MPYPMKPRNMETHRRLTKKQAKLVRARVLHPEATLSELGVKVGYTSAQHVHRVLSTPKAQEAVATEKALFLERMNKRKDLSHDVILDTMADGLKATRVQSVKLDDTIISVSTETPDFASRHKFMETVLEVRGIKHDPKDQTQTGPINLAIIMSGGGSDVERNAVAEVMAASRVSRGLHPTENRKLTEQERTALWTTQRSSRSSTQSNRKR